MFKIGIRWEKGMLKMDVDPNMSVAKLISDISRSIKVDPVYIKLFKNLSKSLSFSDKIEKNRTIEQNNIHKGDIIYMQVDRDQIPKNIPVAQMAMKNDIIDEFVKPGEKIPETVKNIRKEYGTRVITSAFYDMKERGIPQIIEQTESSCYAIRVAEEALKRFQVLAIQSNFDKHRVMFLFGRLDEISGKITIHCSLEPPQKNFEDHFEISPNFQDLTTVEVAKCFGMKLLGMCVSHKGPSKLPLPSYLLRLAAKYQNIYGEYFTTLIMTPRGQSNIEVEAFQVCDAVVNLTKLKLIDDTQNNDPSKIFFKQEIRVFEKKMKSCNVNLCLCAVRIRKTQSKFPSHSFPTLSANPTKKDLVMHFKDNEFCPSWRKFFDFNLLVYLHVYHALPFSHIKIIIDCIIAMSDVPKQILDEVSNFCGYSL